MCDTLAAAKAMRASEAEIATLAENILVVSTYWLNYENFKQRAGIKDDPEKHLTRGVYQVMSLVSPYLVGEAKQHLAHLIQIYISDE
jgi:Bacterial transcriptional repressor